MPWVNLGDFLRDLLRRRINPEEVGVYVPEARDEATDNEHAGSRPDTS